MSVRDPVPPIVAILVLTLAGSAEPAATDEARPAPGPGTSSSAPAAVDRADVQDLIFFGEARPVFVRLHMTVGAKGFRAAWLDHVRSLHTSLDGNRDGKVTTAELDRDAFPGLVRSMSGGTVTAPRVELDNSPKDGVVSVTELADALQSSLGPFGVQVGRVATQRTDALFGQLDHDQDGKLSPAELESAKTMLSKLDLDEDEQIGRDELDPFSDPMIPQPDDDPNRRGRYAAVPPVVELSPEDPTFRPVRLLLKKYDKPARAGAAAGDNMLSRTELGIDSRSFATADTDSDGLLDTEELRRWLSRVTPELEVRVKLPSDGSVNGSDGGTAAVEATGPGGKPLPATVRVQRLSPSDIDIALDEIHLELHAESGDRTVEEARQALQDQFKVADANANNYVEKAEATKAQSALAALFPLIDMDGDGNLYPRELDAFLDRQAVAARSRMSLATADQGRAIFAILDLNRDGQLGLREIRGAPARVMSWDQNRDGRISSDEIPHHYQFTVGRGQVALPGVAYSRPHLVVTASTTGSEAAGPSWFRKMDRNRDGDVSRREFFGPVSAFDCLDRDHDGLIDATEAAVAK
jgi:Ca2+-binding EF-hand superfamily protein